MISDDDDSDRGGGVLMTEGRNRGDPYLGRAGDLRKDSAGRMRRPLQGWSN